MIQIRSLITGTTVKLARDICIAPSDLINQLYSISNVNFEFCRECKP